jgi:hypothetical protein
VPYNTDTSYFKRSLDCIGLLPFKQRCRRKTDTSLLTKTKTVFRSLPFF